MSVVTMKRLGRMGRWGNQLLQFAGLSSLARMWGWDFQYRQWLGEQIFNIPSNPIRVEFPEYEERYDAEKHPIIPRMSELVNHNFFGYCQWNTSFWAGNRNVWQRTYTPNSYWRKRMELAFRAFARSGNTHVGIHIRRGDYGQNNPHDAITPVRWYLDWLEENWATLDHPVLFVATEDPGLLREFDIYGPRTITTLGVELGSAPYSPYNYEESDLRGKHLHVIDFLPEWFMLSQCEHLVVANSTWSVTAALCSHKDVRMYRPCPSQARFVEEDVWNCWPLRLDCKERSKTCVCKGMHCE